MDTIEHDPKTKQQIKDALYTFLYGPVTNQFKKRIANLITRNTIMGGYGHRHFVYKGEFYNDDLSPAPLKRNRLCAALRPEMDDYLEDLRELNVQELPYVLGFINQVLNASPDLLDYTKILPESIHHPLKVLIASCPCRKASLSEEKVTSLTTNNQETIGMIKRRLVTNLLI